MNRHYKKLIRDNIFLCLDKSQKIFLKIAWMSFEIILFCGGFTGECAKIFLKIFSCNNDP